MNKINYDKLMQEIIAKEHKRKLLLHACCAPCASYCITELMPYFDITVYFYNPNIDGEEEYDKRFFELCRLVKIIGKGEIDVIQDGFNKGEFLEIAKGKETLPEGGARCVSCFNLRLESTARRAKAGAFDFFATTLTVSPLKNADILNSIGYKCGNVYGVEYLPTDFKKRNGYKKSVELSKEYNLYRQSYCGCEYSKNKGLGN